MEIKPLTVKDLETREEDKKNAYFWWSTLSINEMKDLTKKHFPVFSYSTLPVSFLIDIFKFEAV